MISTERLVSLLRVRIKQLEGDRTLSSYARNSRIAEVKRLIRLIGENAEK